jgi:adenylate kinase
MNIIILGAPGAGKGTQSEIIGKRFGVPIIGTGAMIREAVKADTPLGQKAKGYMDKGLLLPDELVVGLVEERIAQDDCKAGFILDGFPRTLSQAEVLDRMGVSIDGVLSIEIEDAAIQARLAGRLVCEGCGLSYHIANNPPAKVGVCDRCGGVLSRRKDDNPETIAERLAVYHELTEPLKRYYARRGKLFELDGTLSIEETTRQTVKTLEALHGRS